MSSESLAPNHHAHHEGFSGLHGVVAAVSMLGRHRGDADLVVSLVGLDPSDTVVDLGCGPGTAVRLAAKRGATAIGVDPAPVMLRVARVIPSSRRTRWVTGTAEQTGLDDGVATIVWSMAAVHHWVDLDQGLGEVRRLLRPGGRFVAIERRTVPGATGMASHGWTPDQAERFADQVTEHGFVDSEVTVHDTGRRELVAVRARVPSN